MDIDERLNNIDKDIASLFRMLFRIVAILFVRDKINFVDVEDILNFAKEKDKNGAISSINIGRIK